MRYQSTSTLNDWARYINGVRVNETWFNHYNYRVKYIPNRLTLLYSKIYYKEENYLKVKTAVFKYITPPYSKGWVYQYINILIRYISTFLYSYISNSCHIPSMWLSYPSSCSFTGSISSASCILILSWSNSSNYLYHSVYKVYNTYSLLYIFIFKEFNL